MADNSYKKGGLIINMWIARDKNDHLVLFQFMPQYSDFAEMWYEEHLEDGFYIYPQMFPEVTFENSPREVELVLKK